MNSHMNDAEALAKHLGATLRKLRQERKMSLQELAEITTVSKLTLGNIERGEANPSLAVIWKIANGLAVPLSVLLNEQKDIQISRCHEGNKVVSANEACTLEPMFEVSSYGSSEIHRAFLQPHSEYRPGAHQQGVTEYVTVMSGRLRIQIEEEHYELNQYDSITFNGDKVHAYQNPTSEITVLHFLMTYTSPKP
ncbi:XRE family transcriptional regulator [Alkalihalobacillus oceani]|uniref:XRE family transcriptional regulator n=1 Tax=Halalkalibacter oceani TaxID=1653776 RepID=A0A9X2DPY4_9BACI|nr:XRE family transcriptional regulator [Halalkalibacter oceani]MCM3714541.1 XRE family transcriptional regulator [Halalkalibacter oceani]